MESSREHVAIVGGGISGLATAFYLQRHAIPCTVFEARPRLGGLIHTENVFGCRLEAGPDSFIATKPALKQLAQDLGASEALIPSNDAQRKIFIVRRGALIELPPGMVMIAPGNLQAALDSQLFSATTKRRFAEEMRTPPRQRITDFSVRTLVEDHFGSEVLDYVAEPLLSGVYGGDPGQLSAPSVLPRFVDYESKFGSLITGAQKEKRESAGAMFLSFREGMGQLTSLLETKMRPGVGFENADVRALSRGKEGWKVRTENGDLVVSDVVLAIPAYRAGSILRQVDEQLADDLESIPYSSAILITLLYSKAKFKHPMDGFGFLVPRPERQMIAAATWVNTKFPSRVADGVAALRLFLVDREASRCADVSDSEILDEARADLQRLMGIDAKPLYEAVHRWPMSMPQYVIGHRDRASRISNSIHQSEGLHVVSNYLDGVGIPDCVRWARAVAISIRDRFRSS